MFRGAVVSARLIDQFEEAVHEHAARPKATTARVNADLDAIDAARDKLRERFNILYILIFAAFAVGLSI